MLLVLRDVELNLGRCSMVRGGLSLSAKSIRTLQACFGAQLPLTHWTHATLMKTFIHSTF